MIALLLKHCVKISISHCLVLLDIQLCHFQTMNGAGDMTGCRAGCAALFTEQSPRAICHYSSHDLNLALCKSCEMKEVQAMLNTVKQLGIFLKYSPKRSRCLEAGMLEVQHAIQALYLVPSNCASLNQVATDAVLDYYREDLPSTETFHQEN